MGRKEGNFSASQSTYWKADTAIIKKNPKKTLKKPKREQHRTAQSWRPLRISYLVKKMPPVTELAVLRSSPAVALVALYSNQP